MKLQGLNGGGGPGEVNPIPFTPASTNKLQASTSGRPGGANHSPEPTATPAPPASSTRAKPSALAALDDQQERVQHLISEWRRSRIVRRSPRAPKVVPGQTKLVDHDRYLRGRSEEEIRNFERLRAYDRWMNGPTLAVKILEVVR